MDWAALRTGSVLLILLLLALAAPSVDSQNPQSCATFKEGTPVNIGDLVLSDPDDNFAHKMQGAMVMVKDAAANHSKFVTLSINTTALSVSLRDKIKDKTINSTFNDTAKLLMIRGVATVNEYQEILSNIIFNDSASEPDLRTRTVMFVVSDGLSMSNAVNMYVAIEEKNDNMPQVVLSPESVTFKELNNLKKTGGDPVVLATSVVITDADSSDNPEHGVLDRAWVYISDPSGSEEWLYAVMPANNGIILTGNGSDALVFTGRATLANYSAVLESIRYTNNKTEPVNLTRTILYSVNDGLHNSTIATVNVSIETADDNFPELEFSSNSVNYYATVQLLRSMFFRDMNISDADGVEEDRLISLVNISTSPSAQLTLPSNQTVGTITLTGLNSANLLLTGSAPLQDYVDLVRDLQFQMSASAVVCQEGALQQQHISFTVFNTDMMESDVTTITVAVDVANEHAPVVKLLPSAVSFTEADQTLNETSSDVLVFPNVNISDPDSRDCEDSYLSAAIVRLYGATSSEEEVLMLDPGALLDWTTVSCSNTTTMTVLTGNVRCWQLENQASLGDYVNALKTLNYSSSEPEPVPSPRSLTLQVFDGAQWSQLHTVALDTELLNDWPPVLHLFPDTMTMDGTPVLLLDEDGARALPIAIGATLTDGDITNTMHRQVSTLVVSVQSVDGTVSPAWLDYNTTALPAGFLSIANVTSPGTEIRFKLIQNVTENTTFISNNSTGITSEVLQAILYHDNSEEPTDALINITTVPELSAGQVTILVQVETADDNEPVISGLGQSRSFVEDGPSIAVMPNISITDADTNNINHTYITSVLVTLQDAVDGALEELSVNASASTCMDLTITTVNQSALLLGSAAGPVPIGAVVPCLRQIMYRNTAAEPSPTRPRRVRVAVSSGDFVVVQEQMVHVDAVCDEPIVWFNSNSYAELTSPGLHFISSLNSSETLFDISITYTEITLKDDSYDQGFDVLSGHNPSGAVDFEPVTGTLDIAGTQHITVYSPILANTAFRSNSQSPGIPIPYRDVEVRLTYDCSCSSSTSCPPGGTGNRQKTYQHRFGIADEDTAPMVMLSTASQDIALSHVVRPCDDGSARTALFSNASIVDPDDTMLDFVVVNLTNAAQEDEFITFDTPSLQVSVQRSNTSDNLAVQEVFVTEYTLNFTGGGNDVTAFQTALRNARYVVGGSVVRRIGDVRVVTVVAWKGGLESPAATASITLSNPATGPCLTRVADITYVEDSGSLVILPADYELGTGTFYYLHEVRLDIADFPYSHSLNTSFMDTTTLQVTRSPGNPSSSISLMESAASLYQFNTMHAKDFLRSLEFSSTVQERVRNSSTLTITVLDALHRSATTSFKLTVEPRNDPPELATCSLCCETLNSIVSRNFSVGDLANSSVVTDPDGTGLPYGLIVTSISQAPADSNHLWQYNANGTWLNLPPASVSDCSVVLLPTNATLRYATSPSYSRDINSTLTFQVYDYSVPGDEQSADFCVNGTLNASAVSTNSAQFSLTGPYLNRRPVINSTHPTLLLDTIMEDMPSMVGREVQQFVRTVSYDLDNMVLGMAVVFADETNGMWEVRDTGGTWQAIVYNATSPALLQPTSSLRFTPSRDFNGNASLTAHAWDVENMDFSTASSDHSSFSAGTFGVLTTVLPVNDPVDVLPQNFTVDYTEDGEAVVLFPDLNITDVDTWEWFLSFNLSASQPLHACGQPLPSSFNITHSRGAGGELHMLGSTREVNFNGSASELMMWLRSFEIVEASNNELNFDFLLLEVSITEKESSMPAELASTVQITHSNDGMISIGIPNTDYIFKYTEDSGYATVFAGNPVRLSDNDCPPMLSEVVIRLHHADGEHNLMNVTLQPGILTNETDHPNGRTLQLTGSASAADYEQVLNSLTYMFDDNEEPTDRIGNFSIQAFDGRYYSDELSVTLHIIPDVPPVPVLLLDSGSEDFTTVFREIAEEDAGNASSYAASLTGVVSLTTLNVGDFVPAYVSIELELATVPAIDNETLLLDGTASSSPFFINITNSTLAEYEQALQTVQYINYAKELSGSNRTVRFLACYSSHPICSRPVFTMIRFMPTNDAPVVTFAMPSFTYIEDEQFQAVIGDLELSDSDSVVLASAVVRVSGLDATTEQVNVTQPDEGITISPVQNNGTQQLHFNLTRATDQSRDLLRTVVFRHATHTPPPQGQRTLCVTVTDNDGAASLTVCKIIVLQAVNDAPLVLLTFTDTFQERNYATSFTEGDAPVRIAGENATIVEFEGHDIMSMTVTLTNALDSDEKLTWDMTISSPMVTTSRIAGQEFSLQATGIASAAEYSRLLRTIAYDNPSQRPEPDTRLITVAATDIQNGTSLSSACTVSVTEVDDPAVLVLDPAAHTSGTSNVNFTEEGSAVNLYPMAAYQDLDDMYVDYLRLVLTGVLDTGGEHLQLPYTTLNATVHGDSITYIATFPNPGLNISDTNVLLRSLRYINTRPEPTAGQRWVSVLLTNSRPATVSSSSTVTVVTVNDQMPAFNTSAFSVDVVENQPAAQLLDLALYVEDGDRDAFNSVHHEYTIVSCTPQCMSKFSLSSAGLLSVDQALDREAVPRYQIIAQVVDNAYTAGGSGSGSGQGDASTAIVTVNVRDENDVTPSIQQIGGHAVQQALVTIPVYEGSPLHLPIIAVDMDEGSNAQLTFSISAVSWLSLSVNQTTRAVQSLHPLDYENATSVVFNVSVSDNGWPPLSSTVLVTIAILDLNDNLPTITTPVTVNVCENESPGHVLFSASASDADSLDAGLLRYRLLNLTSVLSVNTTTGDVSLRHAVDYDFGPSLYTVGVEVVDSANHTDSSTTRIRVQNTNDVQSVVFSPTVHVDVRESDGHDAVILTGDAIRRAVTFGDRCLCQECPVRRPSSCDCDLNLTLADVPYSLAVLSHTREFFIDPPQANLNEIRSIKLNGSYNDFEQRQGKPYNIGILLRDYDSQPDSDTGMITVSLVDVNDNPPVFARSSFNVTVRESLAPGRSVLELNATDADSGANGMVEYTIVSATTADFHIPPGGSSSLILQGSLDSDVAGGLPQLRIEVAASDLGSPSLNSTALVYITVADVNDNPPVILNRDNLMFAVREDSLSATQIARINVSDKDVDTDNKQFLFFSSDIDSVFDISPDGTLTLISAALDRESQAEYTFNVTVVDEEQWLANAPPNSSELVPGVTLFDSALVTVVVEDVNDNSPTFTSLLRVFSVSENARPGDRVTRITAADRDAGLNAQLRFSLLGSSGSFNVTSDGWILVSGALDAEKQTQHTLTIVVYDSPATMQPRNATTHVTVNITNENDNAPVFNQSSYSASLPEHSASGTPILRVLAIDDDLHPFDSVAYSIQRVLPPEASMAIEVDAWTGDVRVLDHVSFDREMLPLGIVLVIIANDSANIDSTTVNIMLGDINDSPPQFSQMQYFLRAHEDFTPAGMGSMWRYSHLPVVNGADVVAQDSDLAPNNDIVYAFNATLPADFPFSIESSTGRIFRNNHSFIDIESGPQDYMVTVIASNPHEDMLSDSAIVLIMVNDINDNRPQFLVQDSTFRIEENTNDSLNLTAVDADITPSSIHYWLSNDSSSNASLFSVDSATGKLTITPLDREVSSMHVIKVYAEDSGLPSLTATATLTMVVTDQNDNAPVIRAATDIITVSESYKPLSSLDFRINITDADAGNNSEVTLTLGGTNQAYFSINADAMVSLAQSLDFEQQVQYNFTVIATDQGHPQMRSNKTFLVLVLNENDEPPLVAITPLVTEILEEDFSTNLRPGIQLSDVDMPVDPAFASAHVNIVSRMSGAAGSAPFQCESPENKEEKVRSCGFSDSVDYRLETPTSFSGSNSALRESVGNPITTSSLFIALWINMNNGIPLQNMTIVSCSQSGLGLDVLYNVMCDSTGSLLFQYVNASAVNEVALFPGICNGFLGTWQHISLQAVPQSSISLYINGVFMDSQPFSSFYFRSSRFVVGGGPTFGISRSPVADFFNGTLYGLVVSIKEQPVGLLPCFIECGEALALSQSPPSVLSVRYSNGALRISGNASKTEYESVLNSVRYVDTGDEPLSSGARQVTYRVSDGVQDSNTVVQNLTLILSNEASPVLLLDGTSLNDYPVEFTEGSTVHVPLANQTSLSLTDTDRGLFYFSLTVTLAAVPDGTDEELTADRALANHNGISVNYNVTLGKLTLQGHVSVDRMQLVARTITYHNRADEPNPSNRVVQWLVEESDQDVGQIGRAVQSSTAVRSVVN
eukprot:scpid1393/ scgid34017/ Protocadherin Fat 4; Cadherin family member 14; FAT tumor suppressor homolog 4; Fat-like cadherin protein FAT-J